MIDTTAIRTDPTAGFRMRHPDLGEVHVSAVPTSTIPDDQVYDTVTLMIRYAQTDSASPEIQSRAASLTVPGDVRGTIANIWAWCHSRIQFKLDAEILDSVPGATDYERGDYGVECLVRPVDMDAAIRILGRGTGDCDDFTMSVVALLLACGIPCSIVTIGAYNSPDPSAKSHVYAAAYPADGSGARIALDASHGAYCGWEAPADQVSCKTEYPVAALGSSVVAHAIMLGIGAWIAWKTLGARRVLIEILSSRAATETVLCA